MSWNYGMTLWRSNFLRHKRVWDKNKTCPDTLFLLWSHDYSVFGESHVGLAPFYIPLEPKVCLNESSVKIFCQSAASALNGLPNPPRQRNPGFLLYTCLNGCRQLKEIKEAERSLSKKGDVRVWVRKMCIQTLTTVFPHCVTLDKLTNHLEIEFVCS